MKESLIPINKKIHDPKVEELLEKMRASFEKDVVPFLKTLEKWRAESAKKNILFKSDFEV